MNLIDKLKVIKTFILNRISYFTFFFINVTIFTWLHNFVNHTSFFGNDAKRYFCLFDDAMISMRYAWNFAHGNGLVWNLGERVEGYTNFLMTIIMSLSSYLFDKVTAIYFIQLLGIIIIFLNSFVVMRIFENENQINSDRTKIYRPIIAYISPFLYYPFIYWTLMGMETGILALLLSSCILLVTKQRKKWFDKYLCSVLLGLAYLTRPDSVVYGVLIFFYMINEEFKNSKRVKKIIFFQTIFIYGFFIASHLTFRWIYYGNLFPNTYTLKLVGIDFLNRVKDGINFILPFLSENLFLFIIFSLLVILRPEKKKTLLLSILVVLVSYQIWTGGDPWDYWRIISPVMPLIITLVCVEIYNDFTSQFGLKYTLEFRSKNVIFIKSISGIILLCIALVIIFYSNYRFLPEALFSKPIYQVSDNQINVNISIALKEVTTDKATIAVFSAGVIPYYTGRISIDMLGKSDIYISHLQPDVSGSVSWNGMKSVPGHNKYDLMYSIKKLKPTYVQAFKYGQQDLTDYRNNYYENISYKGASFYLLKNSNDVLWNKLKKNVNIFENNINSTNQIQPSNPKVHKRR